MVEPSRRLPSLGICRAWGQISGYTANGGDEAMLDRAHDPKERDLPSRMLDDVGGIKALAHPLRLALIDLLGQHETLTAAEAARLLDTTAANCSFHLRQLAKHDFVEPVEVQSRREHPWRLKYLGITVADDAGEVTVGFNALAEQVTAAIIERYRAHRRFATQLSKEWRNVCGLSEGTGWLTAGELAELDSHFSELAELATARAHGYSEIPSDARRVDIAQFVLLLDPPSPDTE